MFGLGLNCGGYRFGMRVGVVRFHPETRCNHRWEKSEEWFIDGLGGF
jgi:hypothetical protein